MSSKKPQNIDEYKNWLKEEHKIDILDRTHQTRYNSVISKIEQELVGSTFWTQLTESLKEYENAYLLKTGYPLLLPGSKPELSLKPFESFLLKTYRKNVLENKRWPNEPKDGWVLPDNWYTKVHDIIRTLLVVKYLDGVEFMVDKIKDLCDQHSMHYRVFLEAREEGYYAAHLYMEREFEIPEVTWGTKTVKVSIEIQITTQLQEVIRRLLHKYYEDSRRRIRKEKIKWQWDYESDEFVANYLGHILHYVEGMIMEIREKQKEEII